MIPIIANSFTSAKGRALLIPYLTVGFPEINVTLRLMNALERGGADIIELGIPFSEPVADGEIIRKANEQALSNGANLSTALTIASEYRNGGGSLPLVLMGYANPFLQYGIDKLLASCETVGISGILPVDWPVNPTDEFTVKLTKSAMDRISLVAPNTPEQRVKFIENNSSGYLYYVSVKGVTGVRADADLDGVIAAGTKIKQLVKLPVAVGFGVSDPLTCAKYGKHFDAVIIGSRILITIGEAPSGKAEDAVVKLVGEMREALT